MNDNSKDIEKAQKKQDRLIEEQINLDKTELEEKRKSVFEERLRISRSMGAQLWTPSVAPRAPATTGNSGKNPKLHYTGVTNQVLGK